jgi:ATPase subunit of ABC transporter with duplicated ATPase domains
MISFSNINKQYGKQLVFVEASFQLNPGEKVGLVGPNGSGKTTLFRMVVSEEEPDEGSVSVPRKLTIGYFRQDVEEMQGRSVLDEAIAGSGRAGDLHHELEVLQHAMEDPAQAPHMDRRCCTAWALPRTRLMAMLALYRADGKCEWRWPASYSDGRTCS